jgi:hypothetical protein
MLGHGPSHRRQRFTADYVLPTSVATRFHHRHPEAQDAGPVLRALRQWLRLRILSDEPMGIPSVAVGESLKDFLRSNDGKLFEQNALGGRHGTRLRSLILPDEAAAPAMALTWSMACYDQDEPPRAPMTMPDLFTADLAAGVRGGWSWVMHCWHEPCRQPGHCIHHDLLPALPSGQPQQTRFHVPEPYRLVDKSDNDFGPGNGG